jgi:tyrosinase
MTVRNACEAYTDFVSLPLQNDLQTKGRAAIDAAIAKSTSCTKDKLRVRREWYVSQRSHPCHT